MKHRDRIIAALNHEEPDRCPHQISLTPEFASRLKAKMAQENGADHNPHGGGNTYQLERALDEDMLLTSVGWVNSYKQEAGSHVDEWGVGWKSKDYDTCFGSGRYNEVCEHPLSDDDSISKYTPPDPSRPELYEESARVIDQFKDE